ncbi:septal ring lytic transglycosylase RlpA family protein [Kaarinaea lacus]
MAHQQRTICQSVSKPSFGGLILLSLLSGCGTLSSINQDSAPAKTMDWENIPDAVPRVEPLSETGNPESYVVSGQRYFVDFNAINFRQQGVASWYGTKFHGRKTSSGEVYDMYAMTAAHKTLPLPSYVKVKNLHNDKEVIVKVNDRGPFVDGRIIDLSYAAAQKLGIVNNGTAHVEIETVPPADAARQPAASQLNVANNPGISSATYYVQLGAFSHRAHAEKLLSQLKSQAITSVSISSINKSSIESDNNMFRVRVGPFTNKQQLQAMESQLSELGYTTSYIIAE